MEIFLKGVLGLEVEENLWGGEVQAYLKQWEKWVKTEGCETVWCVHIGGDYKFFRVLEWSKMLRVMGMRLER